MAKEEIEGLGLPYGIKSVSPVLYSAWSGPYTSLQNAKDTIPNGVRLKKMLVFVTDDIGLYWFKDGITDNDIKPLIEIPDGPLGAVTIDVSEIAEGNITVTADDGWMLDGIKYETVESPKTFPDIELSDTGKQRYIVFYGDDEGEIGIVEGTESEAAVMPDVPENAVPLGYTLVTDAEAEPPIIDDPNNAKLNGGNDFYGQQKFKGANYIEVHGVNRGGFRAFDSEGNYLGDFQFENSPSFKGFKISQNINYPANTSVASTPIMTVVSDTKHVKFFGTVEGNNPVNPQDFVTKSFFLSNYQQHFRGKFPSLASLESNVFDPPLIAGDYAQVDEGVGSQVKNYNWDADDEEWVEGGSGSAATNTDMLPEGSTNLYFTVARVLASALTGYGLGSNVAISATDTILQAFGKVQAQINAKQNTLTFDSSPTSGSTNPVTSGGVFTALGDKAEDADVLHKAGNENITGTKTFETSPILDFATASRFLTTGLDKTVESEYAPVAPYITNSTTQSRLSTDSNWNDADVYTGPALDETQGAIYKDANYEYEMYDPTTPIRYPIGGRLRRLIGISGNPSITAGAAAGASPSISVTGNDISCRVTLTTGTATASGVLFTVTFNRTFGSAPRIQLTARNNNAAQYYTEFFVSNETTTTFVISTRTALPASTQFLLNFLIAQ